MTQNLTPEQIQILLNFLPETDRIILHDYFGDTKGYAMLVVWWTAWVLATTMLIVRIYTRIFIGSNGRLRLDDWLLFISWIFMSGTMACAHMTYVFGVGQGVIRVFQVGRPEDILKNVFAGSILYLISFSFSKGSLMALYWMLLGRTQHMRKWLIMATMYIVLTSIALVLWKIFICLPIKRQYDISSGQYDLQCHWRNCVVLYAAYGLNVISDIILIALSIFLLRGLKLPMREKLGVFAIFALVFITIACSTARVVVMRKTKDLLMIITWSYLEAAVAIMVTSMPALKALITRVKGDTRKGTRTGDSGGSDQTQSNRSEVKAGVVVQAPIELKHVKGEGNGADSDWYANDRESQVNLTLDERISSDLEGGVA